MTAKRAGLSAFLLPSVSSMNNFIGQNWSAQPGSPQPLPYALQNPSNNLPAYGYGTVLALSGFALQAPCDQPFLAGSSSILIELDGFDGFMWQPLWNGATVGETSEYLSVALSSSAQGSYYAHRVVLNGDGVSAIAVSQCWFFGLSEMALAPVLLAPPPGPPPPIPPPSTAPQSEPFPIIF